MCVNVCTISKDIVVNMEKETCLPNKECMSGHRCERSNTTAKCEMSMDCTKNVIGICEK